MNTDLIKSKSTAGFTLAEIVVVIGVASIIIVFSIGILLSNYRFYNNQSGEIRAINQTREAGDRINEFGRGADQFVSSFTYAGDSYTTSSTTVIFRLPAVDSNGDIVAGAYDHVIVSKDLQNESRLILITAPHQDSSRRERLLELTDRLTSISLAYDSTDLASAKQVSYEMIITHQAAFPASERISGSVTLRN